MSDFRVHPVLISPSVAAVVSGIIAAVIVDVGVSQHLAIAGEAPMNAEAWEGLVDARWLAIGISAVLGGFASFLLFRSGSVNIQVPWAGILLGAVGVFGTAYMVWRLYLSIHMPEYQDGFLIISKLAGFWSVLLVLGALGCVRFALRSYRIMREA